jgi:hypothetical protein
MGPMAKGNKNLTEQVILKRALKNLYRLDALGIVAELNKLVVQLKFHLPQLIPKSFQNFPKDNVGTIYKRSSLDKQAEEILNAWGWVDAELYKHALKLYQEKQSLAEKCLKLFGEDATSSGEMMRDVDVTAILEG